MNAVIRSMHSRIVDTDIGECDRVDERCGRWLATIVGVFVVEVEVVVVVLYHIWVVGLGYRDLHPTNAPHCCTPGGAICTLVSN